MDIIRAILIAQFLTIGVILGAAWLTIRALRPRPRVRKMFDKPQKKQVLNTPSGSFIINDKREPIDNSDESLWEREN